MLRILEGTYLPCNPLESLHFPPDLPPAFRADGYRGLRRLVDPRGGARLGVPPRCSVGSGKGSPDQIRQQSSGIRCVPLSRPRMRHRFSAAREKPDGPRCRDK
jgi:hypothetical protein